MQRDRLQILAERFFRNIHPMFQYLHIPGLCIEHRLAHSCLGIQQYVVESAGSVLMWYTLPFLLRTLSCL